MRERLTTWTVRICLGVFVSECVLEAVAQFTGREFAIDKWIASICGGVIMLVVGASFKKSK